MPLEVNIETFFFLLLRSENQLGWALLLTSLCLSVNNCPETCQRQTLTEREMSWRERQRQRKTEPEWGWGGTDIQRKTHKREGGGGGGEGGEN